MDSVGFMFLPMSASPPTVRTEHPPELRIPTPAAEPCPQPPHGADTVGDAVTTEKWAMLDFLYAAQVHMWHTSLTPNKMMHLKAGLKEIQNSRITVRFGTGFTGCEIAYTAAKHLQRYWKENFGIIIPIALVVICEKDKDVQTWLTQHFHLTGDGPQCFHREMAEMSRCRAYCVIKAKPVLVKRMDIWLGGFVCIDKSRLNPHRGKHTDSVQNESGGQTQATCDMAKACLGVLKPDGAVLENVDGMMLKTKGNPKSDADHVDDSLRGHGFCIQHYLHDAERGGSLADRLRCWWNMLLVSKGGNMKRLQLWHSLVAEIQATPPSWTQVFGPRFELFTEFHKCNGAGQEETAKSDPQFRQSHIDLFRLNGLDYPPLYNLLPQAWQDATSGMYQRERELSFLIEHLEPYHSMVTFNCRVPQILAGAFAECPENSGSI